MKASVNFRLLPAVAATAALLHAGTALATATDTTGRTQNTTTQSTTTTTTGTATARTTANTNLRDDTLVTLSGTVADIVENDAFHLNYGGGTVRVDTNDTWPNLFDTKSATRYLKKGDRVTVTGKVDDNWFTKKEIDAHSLYLDDKNQMVVYNRPGDRRIFADDTYPENRAYFSEGSRFSFTGTVTEVKNDDEFIINYGTGTIQVDLSKVDDVPDKWIQPGDRVSVFGKIDNGLFEKREVIAEGISKTNRTYGRNWQQTTPGATSPAR